MTIKGQLREMARRADEHQQTITVDEVIARDAMSETTTPPVDLGSGPRRPRQLGLLGAAAVVILAVAIWSTAPNTREDRESVSTGTVPPTSAAPVVVARGAIAFAADASGGPTLTDPVDYGTAELRPQAMDIYVTREGEATRRLVGTDAHERCPSFSPDGRRLVYVAAPTVDGTLAPSIVVVPLNPEGEPGAPEMRTVLTASQQYESRRGAPCPVWSPDGRRIAYVAYGSQSTQLRVSTLDGRERVVYEGSMLGSQQPFAWSPDGSAIAYVSTDGVMIDQLDGTAPGIALRATQVPDDADLPSQAASAVSWSSRNELAIAVVTTFEENVTRRKDGTTESTSRDELKLHVVNVATGADVVLDVAPRAFGELLWSPDGSKLAFVDGELQIVVVNRADASWATVPLREDDPEFVVLGVTWSPDAERLVALARSATGRGLVSMSPDGSSTELVSPWTWAFAFTTIGDVSWQATQR